MDVCSSCVITLAICMHARASGYSAIHITTSKLKLLRLSRLDLERTLDILPTITGRPQVTNTARQVQTRACACIVHACTALMSRTLKHPWMLHKL
jgi:hypothetical protein